MTYLDPVTIDKEYTILGVIIDINLEYILFSVQDLETDKKHTFKRPIEYYDKIKRFIDFFNEYHPSPRIINYEPINKFIWDLLGGDKTLCATFIIKKHDILLETDDYILKSFYTY